MRFESDVISDGTQTVKKMRMMYHKFESDVISDGTQTGSIKKVAALLFESDVISDGTQTKPFVHFITSCLRVM